MAPDRGRAYVPKGASGVRQRDIYDGNGSTESVKGEAYTCTSRETSTLGVRGRNEGRLRCPDAGGLRAGGWNTGAPGTKERKNGKHGKGSDHWGRLLVRWGAGGQPATRARDVHVQQRGPPRRHFSPRPLAREGNFEYGNGDTYEGDEEREVHGQERTRGPTGVGPTAEWYAARSTGTGVGFTATGTRTRGRRTWTSWKGGDDELCERRRLRRGLVNSVPHGNGVMTYAYGDRYEGQFQGCPYGRGTLCRRGTTEGVLGCVRPLQPRSVLPEGRREAPWARGSRLGQGNKYGSGETTTWGPGRF